MDDPRLVDRGQRGDRTDGQPVQRGAALGSFADHGLVQRGALDVLGDEVGAALVGAAGEDLRGAEGRYPLCGLRLADEALERAGVVGEPGPQQFDRCPPLGGAFSQIDDALPALAEPPAQHIVTQATWVFVLQRIKIHEEDYPDFGPYKPSKSK
jgi:hypothetical protein